MEGVGIRLAVATWSLSQGPFSQAACVTEARQRGLTTRGLTLALPLASCVWP